MALICCCLSHVLWLIPTAARQRGSGELKLHPEVKGQGYAATELHHWPVDVSYSIQSAHTFRRGQNLEL